MVPVPFESGSLLIQHLSSLPFLATIQLDEPLEALDASRSSCGRNDAQRGLFYAVSSSLSSAVGHIGSSLPSCRRAISNFPREATLKPQKRRLCGLQPRETGRAGGPHRWPRSTVSSPVYNNGRRRMRTRAKSPAPSPLSSWFCLFFSVALIDITVRHHMCHRDVHDEPDLHFTHLDATPAKIPLAFRL